MTIKTTTKEQLHRLVDQLDNARAEAMLTLLTPPNGATNGQSAETTKDIEEDVEDIDAATARDLTMIADAPPLNKDHPIWSIVGKFSSAEPTDIANHKDEYVADAIEGHWE